MMVIEHKGKAARLSLVVISFAMNFVGDNILKFSLPCTIFALF